MTVGAQGPGVRVVGAVAVEDLDEAVAQGRVVDRRRDFDAAVEVAGQQGVHLLIPPRVLDARAAQPRVLPLQNHQADPDLPPPSGCAFREPDEDGGACPSPLCGAVGHRGSFELVPTLGWNTLRANRAGVVASAGGA